MEELRGGKKTNLQHGTAGALSPGGPPYEGMLLGLTPSPCNIARHAALGILLLALLLAAALQALPQLLREAQLSAVEGTAPS